MARKGQYFIPQDLKTKPMIFHNIGLSEFFAMLLSGLFAYLLAGQAHLVLNSLQVPFIVYCVLVAIIMVSPSPWNRGKKIYQSLQYAVTKDRRIYSRIYTEESDFTRIIHRPFISIQRTRAEKEQAMQASLQGLTNPENQLDSGTDIFSVPSSSEEDAEKVEVSEEKEEK